MADLLVDIELDKLARELGTDVAEVEFLGELSREELADLRHRVSQALFAPQEHRFGRFAASARLVPSTIAAKGAEVALGPLVASRVAAVTDPEMAVRMAGHLDRSFLATMSPFLDPDKVAGIVSRLPEQTVVEVGHLLVERREYIPLGRFVSYVPVRTALRVVEVAGPLELLQIALYTEDAQALDGVIAELPDQRIADVLSSADAAGKVDDTLALLEAISAHTRNRVVRITSGLDTHVRDALIRAVARNQAWEALVPVLEHIGTEEVRSLLDVPALDDPQVRQSLLASAAGHPAAERLMVELSLSP